MRNVKRFLPWLLAVAYLDCGASPALITVNDFGDAGPGNCTTTCTLRDAISAALASVPLKGVTFSAAAGWPQTITLSQGQLSINNTSGSTFLVLGPGAAKLAVSASNTTRVLQVSAGVNKISALTLRDGKTIGFSPGSQPFGSGNPGQDAGSAAGGCIVINGGATLILELSDVRNCVAQGGTGGNGGSGITTGTGTGGTGGNGGGGGAAAGGGIYSDGALSLIQSSVVNASVTSGPGGNGGAGGPGFPFNGIGGNGGPAGIAAGGGIAVTATGNVLIRNTTLAGSTAAAGNGGNGGNGGTVSASGNGGNGGSVNGGQLYIAGAVVVADLEFTTLANGTSLAGGGGFPGATGSPIGGPGQSGVARGSGIYSTGPTSAIVASSVIVGASAGTLCYGSIAADAGSVNLDQDSSCTGFTLHDTFAHVLLPLNLATTGWPGYEPVYHSSIVDAATGCTQIGGVIVVADDQHGTPRPQGAKCDLGAIESDYLFANGFN